MKKSKREIKKELKKDMQGKMKTKLKFKVKKKMKKFKLIFIITTTIAFCVAAIKAVNMFLEKKSAKKGNAVGLKDVFAFFASKSVKYAEKINSGVMLGGYFSSLNTDFSDCEFENGTFIAVKCACAYVNIVMPENVNIKFDCINSFAYVKQEYDTESYDETLPTVYIALKGAFSSVFISRAAKSETLDAEVSEA